MKKLTKTNYIKLINNKEFFKEKSKIFNNNNLIQTKNLLIKGAIFTKNKDLQNYINKIIMSLTFDKLYKKYVKSDKRIIPKASYNLSRKIKFNDLKPLLIKNNSIKLNQEKWFKNIGQGNISIKDEIYTLMLTENKRELIFDNNNIFIETKPIKINLI